MDLKRYYPENPVRSAADGTCRLATTPELPTCEKDPGDGRVRVVGELGKLDQLVVHLLAANVKAQLRAMAAARRREGEQDHSQEEPHAGHNCRSKTKAHGSAEKLSTNSEETS